MKRIMEKVKEIIFGHVGICILLLCAGPFLFISHGIFREIEIEQAPFNSDEEDLIVVGVSQLGSESGWRKDAGIPVIIIDRMVDVEDDSLYTTWIGTDARSEGQKAGRWLERYLRTKDRQSDDINIIVLQGTIGSTAEIGRTRGFEEIAKNHENWHILESATGDFTAIKGKEVMRDMLRRYPDIDVLVSQNDDMTMGAIEAMQEAGVSFGEHGKVKVISFDAIHDALEMVDAGMINVDIECNPVQGAYIDMIIRKLEKGEPIEKSYVVEENVFTKDNVSEFLDGRTY